MENSGKMGEEGWGGGGGYEGRRGGFRVHACVRACMRACMCVCVCECVCVSVCDRFTSYSPRGHLLVLYMYVTGSGQTDHFLKH